MDLEFAGPFARDNPPFLTSLWAPERARIYLRASIYFGESMMGEALFPVLVPSWLCATVFFQINPYNSSSFHVNSLIPVGSPGHQARYGSDIKLAQYPRPAFEFYCLREVLAMLNAPIPPVPLPPVDLNSEAERRRRIRTF